MNDIEKIIGYNETMDKIYLEIEGFANNVIKFKDAYKDYTENEYQFVQDICLIYYPLREIFIGKTNDLGLYLNFSKNVQKTVIHHMIVDNSKLYDPNNSFDYLYDNCYSYLHTLEEVLEMFSLINVVIDMEPQNIDSPNETNTDSSNRINSNSLPNEKKTNLRENMYKTFSLELLDEVELNMYVKSIDTVFFEIKYEEHDELNSLIDNCKIISKKIDKVKNKALAICEMYLDGKNIEKYIPKLEKYYKRLVKLTNREKVLNYMIAEIECIY